MMIYCQRVPQKDDVFYEYYETVIGCLPLSAHNNPAITARLMCVTRHIVLENNLNLFADSQEFYSNKRMASFIDILSSALVLFGLGSYCFWLYFLIN